METEAPDTSGTVITEHSMLHADFGFEELSDAIMAEEAWGLMFSDNKITVLENQHQNIASFEEYGKPGHPSDCKLLPDSSLPPRGYGAEWRGTMLVRGRVRHVVLYRKTLP